ncbi:MAG: hypothetical protein ISS48_00410 [Candidatus Aenigmarchaeota archaeon]|nr:hypothetical protein [Candidatus Aenigmarchaeota archaeon]
MIPSYILGLWAGDKYWRSSSIGLSNTNFKLLNKFKRFFINSGFPIERLKLSVYVPENFELENLNKQIKSLAPNNTKFYKLKKGPRPTFILYINSRPLKREFFETLENVEFSMRNKKDVFEYLGGRFDADGHFDKNKNRIRICYSKEQTAKKDKKIIKEIIGSYPKLKYYKAANEWILDFSGKEFRKINEEILKQTIRYQFLQSRRHPE